MNHVRLLHFATTVMFLAIVVWLTAIGVQLRRWTWEQTTTIRYVADMQNAWDWGSRAAREGYFPLYDRVVTESPAGSYVLDYVPLRLGVMTLWAKWADKKFPGTTEWRADYEFNAPLLHLNTAMEFAAAAGIFSLVRQWIRKERPRPARFFDGHWIALTAAALVWFNFSSIFSAHARPTWDVWVIPFYVWAVFFASRNNWFIAGVLVGVGSMLKGQQLVVAPFFLLWPIFSLRFGAATRFLIGLALSAGLIVSPWLIWLTPKWGPLLICLAAVSAGPAVWAILRFIPRMRRFAKIRPAIWLSLFCLAAAIWCSPLLFATSTAWLKVGFIYGVDKMPNLETGHPASFAAILQHNYNWDSTDPAAVVPFTHWALSMKALLATIGYVLIAVSAGAAAWHARNHDRRFLLAAAAPWVIYFTIFPQMHERYLLWGSLMTAAAVSVSVGLTGLNLLLTAFSWIMGMDQLLRDGRASEFGKTISPTFGRSLMRFTHGTIPDSGWAILVICLTWLWLMFAARSKRSSTCSPASPEGGASG